jgi:hypothetical protein
MVTAVKTSNLTRSCTIPSQKLTVTHLVIELQTCPTGIRYFVAPHHIVTANTAVITTTHLTTVHSFSVQATCFPSHTQAAPRRMLSIKIKHCVLHIMCGVFLLPPQPESTQKGEIRTRVGRLATAEAT